MNIKIAKLISKEFIIGKETEEGDLEDVLGLTLLQTSAQGWSVALTDFMAPFVGNPKIKINIKKEYILASVNADDDLSKKYVEITSGLILPM
jgi:hypothetical protein